MANAEINKFKIDFVGIGFPKSGSTWISHCLSEHPEIDFSKKKETNFFISQSLIDSELGRQLRRNSRLTHKEFQRQYTNNGSIKGEFTPFYVYDSKAAKNIKKHNPKTKIIVCLREPATFLNSFFWYDKSSYLGHNMPKTLNEALKSESFIKRANYYDFLKPFFNEFNISQIHIILLEEIMQNPLNVINNLFHFLHVDINFQPSKINKGRNKTKTIKSNALAKIAKHTVNICKKFRLQKVLENQYLLDIYDKINRKNFKYSRLTNLERKEINNIYKKQIIKLEELTNLRFAKWQL